MEEGIKVWSDYGLKTNDDFSGQVANLIKVIKACEKVGLDTKSVINILKNSDRKQALTEINEYRWKKTEAERRIEQLKAQQERAKDFGIGEY